MFKIKIKPKPKAHKRITKQSKNSGFEKKLQYKPDVPKPKAHKRKWEIKEKAS